MRYWNDYISHAAISNGSSGSSRSNHKYVYKENVNGKWRYYYPEDIAALKKAGGTSSKEVLDAATKDLNSQGKTSYNTGDHASTPAERKVAVDKQITAYVNNLRKQGVSSDAIKTIREDLRASRNNYASTDDSKVYRSYSQATADDYDKGYNKYYNRAMFRQNHASKNALTEAKKKSQAKKNNKLTNTSAKSSSKKKSTSDKVQSLLNTAVRKVLSK